jgi:phage FluMu protein Com
MREKFTLVPVNELTVLEITCPKCKTIVVFDLIQGKAFFHDQCPFCPNLYNGITGKFSEALQAYKKFHGTLDSLGFAPHFRLKEDAVEPSN